MTCPGSHLSLPCPWLPPPSPTLWHFPVPLLWQQSQHFFVLPDQIHLSTRRLQKPIRPPNPTSYQLIPYASVASLDLEAEPNLTPSIIPVSQYQVSIPFQIAEILFSLYAHQLDSVLKTPPDSWLMPCLSSRFPAIVVLLGLKAFCGGNVLLLGLGALYSTGATSAWQMVLAATMTEITDYI